MAPITNTPCVRPVWRSTLADFDVRRFEEDGVGIAIARAALRRNAQPEPIFDVQPNWVRCVLKARPDAREGAT